PPPSPPLPPPKEFVPAPVVLFSTYEWVSTSLPALYRPPPSRPSKRPGSVGVGVVAAARQMTLQPSGVRPPSMVTSSKASEAPAAISKMRQGGVPGAALVRAV